MKKDNNIYNKHRVGMLHDLVQISEKEREKGKGRRGWKEERGERRGKEGRKRQKNMNIKRE